MKILLIAGHGEGDSGAVAKIDGVTYKEADLTREVVANLKPCLKEYGINVGVFNTSANAYSAYKAGNLTKRIDFNEWDYVLEVHFNACVNDLKGNGKTTGVECYWPSRGKESGLELPITSRIAKLGFKQRTNKAGQLAVINTAAGYGKKANLLEVCFIDDADDMRLYLKNKKQIAQAIADGIASYYKLKPIGEAIKTNVYRVQVGAYSSKANADATVKKLKEAGFDATIV